MEIKKRGAAEADTTNQEHYNTLYEDKRAFVEGLNNTITGTERYIASIKYYHFETEGECVHITYRGGFSILINVSYNSNLAILSEINKALYGDEDPVGRIEGGEQKRRVELLIAEYELEHFDDFDPLTDIDVYTMFNAMLKKEGIERFNEICDFDSVYDLCRGHGIDILVDRNDNMEEFRYAK